MEPLLLLSPRALSGALALLVALALPPAASAQVVFDDFDDGDVSDVFTFSETNGGIGVGPIDGWTGAEATGLNVGVDPATTGSFAGFGVTGGDGTTDVSSTDVFTFYFRPTTVMAENLPLTLEINFHEDVNGNGAYDGAVEDEFQATYSVTTGSGYTYVEIPLAAFTDDNAVFPGADDGFDYSNLLEVVVAFGGPTGPEFSFSMDDLVFRESAPLGDISEFDFFDDGNVDDISAFSETNAGVGVGPIDDASGTDASALGFGVNPADAGGFVGFVVPGGEGTTDISDAIAFTFQLRAGIVAENAPITLEVNLHEDVNGDGTYDGAVEDEFQTTYQITGPSDYVDVVIPISAFTDDNSVFEGSNDGFDFSNLLEIVFAIGGPMGPEYTLSFDQMGFAAAGTAAEGLPEVFAAAPVAFPNPTAGAATVAFDLAAPSAVTVDVLDVLGRRVATLADGTEAAGTVQLAVPAGTLAPGTYLVRVQTEAGVASTRLTVAR